jgi:hypothetical protein
MGSSEEAAFQGGEEHFASDDLKLEAGAEATGRVPSWERVEERT